MASMIPLFGLPVGPEVIVILLVVVLLFGANKIPKLARSTGQAMGEFRRGREEIEDELQGMEDGLQGVEDGESPNEDSSRSEEKETAE